MSIHTVVAAARLAVVVLIGFASLAFTGCREEERIERISVPKPTATAREGVATDRMLAVIVPQGKEAWTFKATGTIECMAQVEPALREFLESVKFEGPNHEPSWKLPEKWQQLPGSQFRFATLRVGSVTPPTDISVSSVTWQPDEAEEMTLLNVNRWCGQMKLPPIRESELPKQTETIDVAGVKATFVKLDGQFSGGMTGAPFAGGGQMPNLPAMPVPSKTPPTPAPANRVELPIKYETPAEWKPAAGDTFSLAAWQAEDGDRKARITITALSEQGGDLLSNVNRWRTQLQMEPIKAEQLSNEVKSLDIGGVKGHLAELIGPQKSMLGAIALQGGRAYFFKLTGDAPVVEREEKRFEAFLKSVQFTSGNPGDGK